jgi:hypothetical protein
MPEFLTDDWFAHVSACASALPVLPGATLRMQHVVTGAPSGKVQCTTAFVDGRVVEAGLGKDPDATCTVTWTFDQAREALLGILDLDVVFMQGRLKVDGDHITMMLGLRPVFASESGRAFVAAVRDSTTFPA